MDSSAEKKKRADALALASRSSTVLRTESDASSSEPLMFHAASDSTSSRGKGRKYYGVRVGRKVGVFSTWDECKAVVNGVSASEVRSFPTEREAMEYVNSGRVVRTVSYMNLAPSSFVPGRAMRAVVIPGRAGGRVYRSRAQMLPGHRFRC
jgi:hypothetical protein